MCTVTFVPTDQGFIFSSNRDEGIHRPPAHQPQYHHWQAQTLLYAKDPTGGGTWFAASNTRATCLLNGAFTRHQRAIAYRKSRGIIQLDSFAYPTMADFVKDYDLDSIEPFTLIFVDYQPKINIAQLKWDGHQAHIKQLSPTQAHIWHSPTLYTDQIADLRKSEFDRHLDSNTPSYSHIKDFHLTHRYETEDRLADFFVPVIKTVSFISFEENTNQHQLRYYDTTSETLTKDEATHFGQ